MKNYYTPKHSKENVLVEDFEPLCSDLNDLAAVDAMKDMGCPSMSDDHYILDSEVSELNDDTWYYAFA